MNNRPGWRIATLLPLSILAICMFGMYAGMQVFGGRSASTVFAAADPSVSHMPIITPEELVKVLQAPKGEKPLVLSVGPYVMYLQAHIRGSEYIGPGSTPNGLEQLRKRVASLPHTKSIVLYCGCCPWSHCPNVDPAYRELQGLGFTKVKVLYIADNFGADWVNKGYPVAQGQ